MTDFVERIVTVLTALARETGNNFDADDPRDAQRELPVERRNESLDVAMWGPSGKGWAAVTFTGVAKAARVAVLHGLGAHAVGRGARACQMVCVPVAPVNGAVSMDVTTDEPMSGGRRCGAFQSAGVLVEV